MSLWTDKSLDPFRQRRKLMVAFWEGAEHAFDELIVVDVQSFTVGATTTIEVLAKLPEADVAHIFGVKLYGNEGLDVAGRTLGEAALAWMRNERPPYIQAKIGEVGRSALPVLSFMRRSEPLV